jgi:hypothetical protein
MSGVSCRAFKLQVCLEHRTYAGTLYVVVLGRTQLIGEDKRIEPERVSLNSSRELVVKSILFLHSPQFMDGVVLFPLKHLESWQQLKEIV